MNHTIFYFVRHGESESNLSRAFTGRYDARLSPLGLEQGKLCASFFAEHPAERVFVSPLLRAKETAEAAIPGCLARACVDERLAEMDVGHWNGMPFSAIEREDAASFRTFRENLDAFARPDGESVALLKERIFSFLSDALISCLGKPVAVFTHAIPIRVLFAELSGIPARDYPWPENASVSILRFSGETVASLSSLQYSVSDHLGGSTSTLKI